MNFTIECMACGGPMRCVWTAHLGERYMCETCGAVEDVTGHTPIETLIGVKPGDSESLDLAVRRRALETFARNEGIVFGNNLTEFDRQFLKSCGISI